MILVKNYNFLAAYNFFAAVATRGHEPSITLKEVEKGGRGRIERRRGGHRDLVGQEPEPRPNRDSHLISLVFHPKGLNYPYSN